MKQISIGRGRECDVRLSDHTDMVSRRQAVIKVSPWGKMEIYDTSSNGTYVNGEKIEKPNGMPVKRGDQVNFAHVVDLDWDQVKDPYKAMRVTVVSLVIAVLVAVILFLVFAEQYGKKEAEDPYKTEEIVRTDSLQTQTEETVVSVTEGTVTEKQTVGEQRTQKARKEKTPQQENGKTDKQKKDESKNNQTDKINQVVHDDHDNGPSQELLDAIKQK